MIRKARPVVAMFGALVYAIVGLRTLWSSAPGVVVDARRSLVTDSGGLGAVSIGVSEILILYALLVLGAIIANWTLAAWAHGSDRTIRVLHRTHRWLIVLPFVLLFLVPVTFFVRPGALSQLLFSTSGLAWGVQFALTVALLGTYAARTSRTI